MSVVIIERITDQVNIRYKCAVDWCVERVKRKDEVCAMCQYEAEFNEWAKRQCKLSK